MNYEDIESGVCALADNFCSFIYISGMFSQLSSSALATLDPCGLNMGGVAGYLVFSFFEGWGFSKSCGIRRGFFFGLLEVGCRFLDVCMY